MSKRKEILDDLGLTMGLMSKDISGMDFSGEDLSNCAFVDVNFSNCNLMEVDFTSCQFANCDFLVSITNLTSFLSFLRSFPAERA